MIPIIIPSAEDCYCSMQDWVRKDMAHLSVVYCGGCGCVIKVVWPERVPRPEGMAVHHIDGNVRNNDPANLLLVRPQRNGEGSPSE